jgi:magnesium transporter
MENFEQVLDGLHLEDLKNDMHPSIFDIHEAYDMLIIRMPVVRDKIKGQSIGFVITGQNSYVYHKENKKFEMLEDRFMGPYKIIDKMTDDLLKSFLDYQNLVVDMEELLYDNKNSNNFMTDWINLKRDLLLIQRILTRTSEMLLAMIHHYEDTNGFPHHNYRDIYEHIERILNSATHQLSKLDYIYNFHNARANDKMNKMIYILTIISAVFLPLNLLVGFFGMNTSGLPFTSSDANGTLSVIPLMFILLVLTFIAIKIWGKKVQDE